MRGRRKTLGNSLAGASILSGGLLLLTAVPGCVGAPEHCTGCLARLADAGAFIQEVGAPDKGAGGSGGAGTIAGSGGAPGTGGSATGGSATGGSATGGARSGGSPGSGGTATGGSGTGGGGTGGASTGGSGSGGSGTGGAGTGGRATGGSGTGGRGTGGAGTGGAGTGGRASGGSGTGGRGTGGAGTGGAADGAHYNFEASTQSWTMAAGTPAFTPSSSTTQHFAGQRSLGAAITATAAATYFIEVSPPTPAIPAGSTVTFHVFVPTGAVIDAIQPYVQDSAFAFTGIYTAVSGLTLGGWTTLTLMVPTAAASIARLGVQVSVTGAWTGTIYVDAVSW